MWPKFLHSMGFVVSVPWATRSGQRVPSDRGPRICTPLDLQLGSESKPGYPALALRKCSPKEVNPHSNVYGWNATRCLVLTEVF